MAGGRGPGLLSSGDTTSFHGTPGEAQQATLTEEEQHLVARLLSDPTYFPIEFRRWLKDYIENAGIQINDSQIVGSGGGAGSTEPTDFPAGIILPFAGTSYGKDCLPCNGAAIDRTVYADLFAAIGTLWGSSSSTNFRVPDLRDRALYGVGSVVGIGQTDGRSTGNRGGPSHSHSFSGNTGQAGQHSHSLTAMLESWRGMEGNAGGSIGVGFNAGISTNQAPNHSHPFSGQTSGSYDTDKPSFAGVQYVITTGVVP